MDEVDVDPVDLGDELVEAVERRLAATPVVPVGPVLDDVLHVRQRDALRPVVDVLTIRPSRVVQAHTQVVEHRFRDIDRERQHLIAHANTWCQTPSVLVRDAFDLATQNAGCQTPCVHVFAAANAGVPAPPGASYDACVSVSRDYDDIPGTFVFDGHHSRMGYCLNMFCMSLNSADNREAFRADEARYLDRFALSAEQRMAVLERQWLRLFELGGNIYYTYKLAACDGCRSSSSPRSRPESPSRSTST